MRSKKIIYFFLFISLISCHKKALFDKYTSVEPLWMKDTPVSFNFNINDTLSQVNLFIKLRTDDYYKYSNLFLIASLYYPGGIIQKDTLEYKMSNSDGSIMGQGNMSIKEHKLWYKGYRTPFMFQHKGDYSLEIRHAVRQMGELKGVKYLEGIIDVGFCIEKIE